VNIPTWGYVLIVLVLAPLILKYVVRGALLVVLLLVWVLAFTTGIVWSIVRLFRRTPPKVLTTAEARLMMRQMEVRDLLRRLRK